MNSHVHTLVFREAAVAKRPIVWTRTRTSKNALRSWNSMAACHARTLKPAREGRDDTHPPPADET
jgi:hypothetical protein